MRVYRPLYALGLLVCLASCSGGDEEKVEEPVEDAGNDEPAAPADAPTEGDTAEPAPAPEAAPAPAPAPPPAAAEPAGFDGAKVTRFVTSYALNVRSGPSKESAVVRHVKWGDQIEVVINGEWAKIGTGEYVSVNRLSETPPQPKAGAKGHKGKAPKAKKK